MPMDRVPKQRAASALGMHWSAALTWCGEERPGGQAEEGLALGDQPTGTTPLGIPASVPRVQHGEPQQGRSDPQSRRRGRMAVAA